VNDQDSETDGIRYGLVVRSGKALNHFFCRVKHKSAALAASAAVGDLADLLKDGRMPTEVRTAVCGVLQWLADDATAAADALLSVALAEGDDAELRLAAARALVYVVDIPVLLAGRGLTRFFCIASTAFAISFCGTCSTFCGFPLAFSRCAALPRPSAVPLRSTSTAFFFVAASRRPWPTRTSVLPDLPAASDFACLWLSLSAMGLSFLQLDNVMAHPSGRIELTP